MRHASVEDASRLSVLNRKLIEDEGSTNRMSLAELEERMRGWLQGAYRAALFTLGDEVVAYALWRASEDGIFLRQFFVERSRRRQGHGRAAIRVLLEQVVPPGKVLELEVLVRNEDGIAFWRALGFEDHALALRVRG